MIRQYLENMFFMVVVAAMVLGCSVACASRCNSGWTYLKQPTSLFPKVYTAPRVSYNPYYVAPRYVEPLVIVNPYVAQ